MKQEIFDYVADSVGIYLSDMKYGVKAQNIASVLNGIPEDMYTLNEWNSFLTYLKEEKADFKSIKDAKSQAVKYFTDKM